MKMLKSVSLALKRAAGTLLLPEATAHTMAKLIKWQVANVDAGFDHSAPLDASGNALGPFTVGQTVKVITEATNSIATRTIVITEPVV